MATRSSEAASEEGRIMANEKKGTEDVQGAIDAVERRVAHLATLVHPEPGERPHRSAHWRDEVELKALRLGVKALRERLLRGPDGTGVVDLLTSTVELLGDLSELVDSRPNMRARIEAQIERIEAILEAMA
jgi:hypothetical protein